MEPSNSSNYRQIQNLPVKNNPVLPQAGHLNNYQQVAVRQINSSDLDRLYYELDYLKKENEKLKQQLEKDEKNSLNEYSLFFFGSFYTVILVFVSIYVSYLMFLSFWSF